jgi:hypothetical protein
MWKYDFRNGPNHPWREENTRVEIEPVQSDTEFQCSKCEYFFASRVETRFAVGPYLLGHA